MMRVLRRLDALPRGLRWALFLPVGIGSALIVDGVLNAVCDAAGLPTSPATTGGVSRAAMLAFAWALTLTFVPAVVSPRPWAVGVVMFAAGLLFRVVPVVSMMTVPYQRARLPSLAVALAAAIGAHALGGSVGLYLIRVLAPRTDDH
jgi:putative flippase GtrA